MKILYIDTATSIENIRIAEQVIFSKEFPKLGHDVYFLLAKNKNKNHSNDKNIYFFNPNLLSKIFINIPVFISLIKISCSNSFDIIAVRNSTRIGIIPLLYAKISATKFAYIKAFPTSEFLMYEYKSSNIYPYKFKMLLKYIIDSILEKFILKNSDIIIPRTHEYLNYLSEKKGVNTRKMIPIPMGFDSEVLNNLDKIKITNIHKEYCKTNNKLLLYFGTFQSIRNLDFLLNVFKKVTNKTNNITLLLIGGNDNEHTELRKIINNLKLSSQVYLLNEIPRIELYHYIKAADLTISPIPPLFIFKISSPTKVIESLGLGTPAIVNEEIEDQRTVIEKSNGGMTVPYDEECFSSAIIELINDSTKLKEMGQNAQKYILKNRSYEKLAQDLDVYITNFKKIITNR